MKPTHRIELNRETCIGSFACSKQSPKFFEPGDDGKVDIVDGKAQDANRIHVRDIQDSDVEEATLAAQSCPVNAIQIIRLKDSKKLI